MRNLTDIGVYDAIAYSGADARSWYTAWECHEQALVLHVEIDLDGAEGSATLTVADLRRAFQDLVFDAHPSVQGIDWLDDVRHSVLARTADQIVQYAVLGDVVFG